MADHLGDRIRAARERKGLTQEGLGELIGVARETVGNWETGVSSPRNKMGALRDVLGDSLDGSVSATDQDAGVLGSLPAEAIEGLGPVERAEVVAAMKLEGLKTARAIRRRVDE